MDTTSQLDFRLLTTRRAKLGPTRIHDAAAAAAEPRPCRWAALSLLLLLLTAPCGATAEAGAAEALLAGVDAVHSDAFISRQMLFGSAFPVATSADIAFVSAATHGAGRVLTTAHEGMLSALSEARLARCSVLLF